MIFISCKNLKRSKVSYEEWKERIEWNGEFELLDTFYKVRKDTGRNETWLRFKHKVCGTTMERNGNLYSKANSNINCSHCGNSYSVSNLHATISTIACKIYDGAKIEYDIGFVGVSGGKSCYDLFIPNYNGKDTLFEFQSRFHDDRKEFDKAKMDFAISHGYNYIALDHRNISVKDAVKLIFGDVSMCEYDDRKMFNRFKIDIDTLQKLVYKYTPMKAIARELGCSATCIKSTLNTGIIDIPKDYMNVIKRQKEVVQLTMDGEFVAEYKSSGIASKAIGKRITVSGCSNGCRNVICRCGYAWLTKEDYENGDYYIYDICQKHCKTFYKIDDDYNILNTYTSLKFACIDNGIISHANLTNALRGKTPKCKNNKYIFKYKYDEEIKQQKSLQK